jgi:hypothetical protein
MARAFGDLTDSIAVMLIMIAHSEKQSLNGSWHSYFLCEGLHILTSSVKSCGNVANWAAIHTHTSGELLTECHMLPGVCLRSVFENCLCGHTEEMQCQPLSAPRNCNETTLAAAH